MVSSIMTTIVLIGFLGIASQWLAWRFQIPAIVVMSITGLLAGPAFGIINPELVFGDLYRPFISVAVAIILFEGSLQLKFKELKGISRPIIRIATLGAFIAWILGTITAHYIAGLSWEVSFIIGGLLIVTGPTVIIPLLRQSKLNPRPAKILKWEGIIVDPIGVLLAVFAFEIVTYFTADEPNGKALILFFIVSAFAAVIGWLGGLLITWLFDNGHVPQYLKSPVVFAAVIVCFGVVDEIISGTGLLSVTAMGLTLANTGTRSVADLKHFKEDISLLLISAIFIMLSASLEVETLKQIFSLNIIGYVLLMMFAVRPLSIFLSTINSGLSLNEKILIGWIAPRGIVAMTVAGYYASVLTDAGYEDANILLTLTFALVIFTVVAHGFSIGPLARKLNLSMEGRPGVLIVGSNPFTVKFAQALRKLKTPVMIVDRSYEKLRHARNEAIPFYHGDMLEEQTEYDLNMIPYEYLVAATDSNSSNALICTTFIPDYGRNNVYRVNPGPNLSHYSKKIADKVGGRILFSKNSSIDQLSKRVEEGQIFRQTMITEQYTYEDYLADKNGSTTFLCFIKPSGEIIFYAEGMRTLPSTGDVIISLTTPDKEMNKIKKKIEEQRNNGQH